MDKVLEMLYGIAALQVAAEHAFYRRILETVMGKDKNDGDYPRATNDTQ